MRVHIEKPGGYFDFTNKEKELRHLQKEQLEPSFWKDPTNASQVTRRADSIREEIAAWDSFQARLQTLKELIELVDKDTKEGLHDEYEKELGNLQTEWKKLEMTVLFRGPYDHGDAIMSLHAGTGGIDAQDWTEMLYRMYARYIEKKGWKTDIISKTAGQEAGIKSIEWQVSGSYAYGYLKAEAGVHRLVRISPFDAEKMRHTSFALVEVFPVLSEEDISLYEKDIKIDTFRASGHGGQSVNTTDSAVRVTHIPTGIVITCQNERSQFQNKKTAIKILLGKLHYLKELARAKEIRELRGDFKKAEWGNQARSYVLQPYKLIKDHRTKLETRDVDHVLDGDLDAFIYEYLKHKP